ncbi:MAG: type II toxin-antitoxin system RelB/DinJ family antitoxin [Coriobacteriia bacterium]|nr:type II toxin-antitoxin system RelB/DinJ family antitoxin [Coriobacteriia bacterium]
MGASTNMSIRMDPDLKREAENLFADLGLNTTSAITIFLRQAVRTQGIPFEVSRNKPNAVTLAAIEEAERITYDPNVKAYTDLDEMFADLKA